MTDHLKIELSKKWMLATKSNMTLPAFMRFIWHSTNEDHFQLTKAGFKFLMKASIKFEKNEIIPFTPSIYSLACIKNVIKSPYYVDTLRSVLYVYDNIEIGADLVLFGGDLALYSHTMRPK